MQFLVQLLEGVGTLGLSLIGSLDLGADEVVQPRWATHGGPQLERAWTAAAAAGLDEGRARAAMRAPHITAALTQDIADANTLGVTARRFLSVRCTDRQGRPRGRA